MPESMTFFFTFSSMGKPSFFYAIIAYLTTIAL